MYFSFFLFYFCCSFEKIKTFTSPNQFFSASLHPSKTCFVAGGEDLKLYKFDYEDGREIGELIHDENLSSVLFVIGTLMIISISFCF